MNHNEIRPKPPVSIDALLELQRVSGDTFNGCAVVDGGQRLFGGLAIAQSIKAASVTAEGHTLRTVQITFMRSGEEETDLEIHVSRLHSGRRMSTRSISGYQHGRLLFSGLALLGAAQLSGTVAVEHSDPPASALIPPDALLPAYNQHIGCGVSVPPSVVPKYNRTGLRFVDAPPRIARISGDGERRSRAWFDLRDIDEANVPAALGYVSDISLLDPIATRHGLQWQDDATPATLTHTLSIHRSDLLSDQLMFDRYSPSASGGVGFVVAAVYNRAGTRVATVTQDAILLDEVGPTPVRA